MNRKKSETKDNQNNIGTFFSTLEIMNPFEFIIKNQKKKKKDCLNISNFD